MGREISLEVAGLPPAKGEAFSMLGAGHSHRVRVVELLRAAKAAMERTGVRGFGSVSLGLEVVLYAPAGHLQSDATNYLGGIADVLESKSHRGAIDHLGELAAVAVYDNDRQIRQIAYRQQFSSVARYTVRLWELEANAT